MKLATKASQRHEVGNRGRRRKGRAALNLRITSIAGNSERQSFVGYTVHKCECGSRILRASPSYQRSDGFKFWSLASRSTGMNSMQTRCVGPLPAQASTLSRRRRSPSPHRPRHSLSSSEPSCAEVEDRIS
ncbi:hypothetical protein EVAR_16860_1 [Eumeta japonica]|uniref:Uncharacterized protein n=1 Tax=Eumeta variegata TaxID=151549 RepID=A0A4C1V344_EUMVA|nr:hypothetical protein EVAR_16860_1 [Eumeta japonica]